MVSHFGVARVGGRGSQRAQLPANERTTPTHSTQLNHSVDDHERATNKAPCQQPDHHGNTLTVAPDIVAHRFDRAHSHQVVELLLCRGLYQTRSNGCLGCPSACPDACCARYRRSRFQKMSAVEFAHIISRLMACRYPEQFQHRFNPSRSNLKQKPMCYLAARLQQDGIGTCYGHTWNMQASS